MNAYIIAYEIRDPRRDYSELYKRIRDLGNHCQPLENVWLLATDKYNEDDIYDTLISFLRSKDFLLISKANLKNIQGWLPVSAWNWIDRMTQEPELSQKE